MTPLALCVVKVVVLGVGKVCSPCVRLNSVVMYAFFKRESAPRAIGSVLERGVVGLVRGRGIDVFCIKGGNTFSEVTERVLGRVGGRCGVGCCIMLTCVPGGSRCGSCNSAVCFSRLGAIPCGCQVGRQGGLVLGGTSCIVAYTGRVNGTESFGRLSGGRKGVVVGVWSIPLNARFLLFVVCCLLFGGPSLWGSNFFVSVSWSGGLGFPSSVSATHQVSPCSIFLVFSWTVRVLGGPGAERTIVAGSVWGFLVPFFVFLPLFWYVWGACGQVSRGLNEMFCFVGKVRVHARFCGR